MSEFFMKVRARSLNNHDPKLEPEFKHGMFKKNCYPSWMNTSMRTGLNPTLLEFEGTKTFSYLKPINNNLKKIKTILF